MECSTYDHGPDSGHFDLQDPEAIDITLLGIIGKFQVPDPLLNISRGEK